MGLWYHGRELAKYMREQWLPAAAPAEVVKATSDVWKQPESGHEAYSQALELARRLKHAAEDPQVRIGVEASLRSLINCAVAIADMVPAYGVLASWSADAAKLWAQWDYAKRCKEAIEQGENPLKVKMRVIDLTPDVHWGWAILTEPLDLCSGDLMPSHAIEGYKQLKADFPRIMEMVARVREYLRDVQCDAERPPYIEAAAAFNVKIAS